LYTPRGDILRLGPIAFKAERDGVTIAKHSNGKVSVQSRSTKGKPIIDMERSNDHSEAWKGMEAVVASGKVRSIGNSFILSLIQVFLISTSNNCKSFSKLQILYQR
jgi:hypothetical protein